MVKYGRFAEKKQEGAPDAIVLFDNLVEAVGPGEKVEIFQVTVEPLGQYTGKFEVVKVEKRARKKRAKKDRRGGTKVEAQIHEARKILEEIETPGRVQHESF